MLRRRAFTVPSRPPPILKSITIARPWFIATMFSLRDSTQRMVRPVLRASQQMRMSSTLRPLAPKPPPTSGPTTRTSPGSMPRFMARPSRSWCGVCVESQAVSLPFSSTLAADARGSSGLAASRWLTRVPSTTTSQPANSSSSDCSGGRLMQVLVPTSGNSSVSSFTASRGSVITGRSS